MDETSRRRGLEAARARGCHRGAPSPGVVQAVGSGAATFGAGSEKRTAMGALGATARVRWHACDLASWHGTPAPRAPARAGASRRRCHKGEVPKPSEPTLRSLQNRAAARNVPLTVNPYLNRTV